MSEPLVTIICLTYNHEAYIADALESFVMQEAPFGLEVLVHDDASTDSTAAVIREYAERYPSVIRPVFQEKNLYSQGISITRDVLYPMARGKYLAFCEGDDYWTDRRKLAKQVASLEAHPECDICAHASAVTKNGEFKAYNAAAAGNKLIPVEKVIIGGGNFVETSSILCRAETCMRRTPFRDVLVNDYTLQIQGALRGGMIWLADCMSVYRKELPGSWSARHAGRDAKRPEHKRLLQMLDVLDIYTGGKYSRAIATRKALYAADDGGPGKLRRMLFHMRRKAVRTKYKLLVHPKI